MMQIEEGNKVTAWRENPEDAEARVAATRQLADNAQQSANNAQTGVNNLRNFTDTVFRNGVIDRAERAAIEGYLNQLAETKLSVDADYIQIRQNPYLAGTALTNLTNAKAALDTAYNNLVNGINTAIANGVVTPAERNEVNRLFGLYNTALVTYQTRLGEANRAILNRIDEIARQRSDAAQRLSSATPQNRTSNL